jgi:hypothetical protein
MIDVFERALEWIIEFTADVDMKRKSAVSGTADETNR